MKPTMRKFMTRLRVRYSETDQMGVVYHANYLVWFEIGRVEMLRELGMAYRDLESDEGCVLPVAELSCRYRQPARYDDELELETRLVALRGPVMKFAYRLLRTARTGEPAEAPATLLADAYSTHVVVGKEDLRSRPLPERYAAVLQACL